MFNTTHSNLLTGRRKLASKSRPPFDLQSGLRKPSSASTLILVLCVHRPQTSTTPTKRTIGLSTLMMAIHPTFSSLMRPPDMFGNSSLSQRSHLWILLTHSWQDMAIQTVKVFVQIRAANWPACHISWIWFYADITMSWNLRAPIALHKMVPLIYITTS